MRPPRSPSRRSSCAWPMPSSRAARARPFPFFFTAISCGKKPACKKDTEWHDVVWLLFGAATQWLWLSNRLSRLSEIDLQLLLTKPPSDLAVIRRTNQQSDWLQIRQPTHRSKKKRRQQAAIMHCESCWPLGLAHRGEGLMGNYEIVTCDCQLWLRPWLSAVIRVN